MFKELGYKLKAVAYAVYWICLAVLVILGVFMILKGNLFGYVIAFSSIFVSWIPGAVVYAIGEMYEKVMYEGKKVPIFKTKAQKQDAMSLLKNRAKVHLGKLILEYRKRHQL